MPFPGYGSVKFDKNVWTYSKKGLHTSFQLYLQNLRVVAELCNEANRTNDVKYLTVANEITESWIDFIHDGHETAMTWYDHAIAFRARTILYLLATNKTFGLTFNEQTYRDLIDRHAASLMDDANHRMNNHGIMFDHALIACGFALDNDTFVIKGMGRVTMIFWRTFSHLGVHQENSPEYHKMVSRMYRELEAYLNDNGHSLGQDVKAVFADIDKYPHKLALPSRKLPAIGDSGQSSIASEPKWGPFHDQLSGLSISKHKKTSTYLAFICGYSQNAHKHSDDLSILLSKGSNDYLVDSGKFNYGNNKYRKYVTSASAHSSFSLSRSYSKDPNNRIKRLVFTDHFFDSESMTIISGYNASYAHAFLRRTIYFIKECEVIIINDRGISTKDDEVFRQTFNFSPKIALRHTNDAQTHTYAKADDTSRLKIKHHNGVSGEIKKGDASAASPTALISPRSHKVVPTHQLVYESSGTRQLDSWISLTLSEIDELEPQLATDRRRVRVGADDFNLPAIHLWPSEMYCNSADEIKKTFQER